MMLPCSLFDDSAPTEIYTLSLHDALPISDGCAHFPASGNRSGRAADAAAGTASDISCSISCASHGDRKSTRLNSSHSSISYAVFCLKKKRRLANLGPVHDPKLQADADAHD